MTRRGLTGGWVKWTRALVVGAVTLGAVSAAQAAPARVRAAAPAAQTLTVSVCDQAHLAAAVAQANADNAGDTIVFTCSGDILLNATLQLSGAMTIDGSGQAVTLDGQNSTQLVAINGGVSVTLNALTLANGRGSQGGAIDNSGTLALTGSTISGNSASFGGGLFNYSGATAALTAVTLSGNSATYGAGLFNIGALTLSNSTLSGNTTGSASNGTGGGLYNIGAATATLANTTISGNTASSHGGGIDNTAALTLTAVTLSGNSATYGAGLYNAGTLTLDNSTLSGNTAGAFGYGGGLDNDSGATAALANTTISGNSSGYGGGLFDASGAALMLSASIIAGNTGSFSGPDCYGTLTSGDYNLVLNTSTCTLTGATGHNITGQDPLLGPLQNNGGPTQTMLPGAGSPALNDVPTGSGLCPATDQRGLPRPDAGESACDIGAVEVAEPPATLSFSPNSGQYGQPLTVSGQNFGPAEQVNVYDAHGALVYSAATQQDGSFALNTTAAAAPFGPNTYTAIGQSSGNEATTVFTAQPLAQLSPATASPGTPDAVSGYGFGASEPVTAYLGTVGGAALGGATSNGNGSYAISFRVPRLAGGSYNVVSVGATSGAVYTDTLSVIPALHISPTHGKRGSKATVSGAGYGAKEHVRVLWDCASVGCAGALPLGTRTTTANGVLSGLSVTIPLTATAGLHTIGGVGLSSQTFATTTFRVTR